MKDTQQEHEFRDKLLSKIFSVPDLKEKFIAIAKKKEAKAYWSAKIQREFATMPLEETCHDHYAPLFEEKLVDLGALGARFVKERNLERFNTVDEIATKCGEIVFILGILSIQIPYIRQLIFAEMRQHPEAKQHSSLIKRFNLAPQNAQDAFNAYREKASEAEGKYDADFTAFQEEFRSTLFKLPDGTTIPRAEWKEVRDKRDEARKAHDALRAEVTNLSEKKDEIYTRNGLNTLSPTKLSTAITALNDRKKKSTIESEQTQYQQEIDSLNALQRKRIERQTANDLFERISKELDAKTPSDAEFDKLQRSADKKADQLKNALEAATLGFKQEYLARLDEIEAELNNS